MDELEGVLTTFSDPRKTLSQIMDARSKLGYVLHKCCCENALTTVTILVSIMNMTPFSFNFSMILEASVSYCLQYVSVKDKGRITSCYIDTFRKHINSENPDHISNLTKFLQSGGCVLIPNPDVLLIDLLNLSTSIGSSVLKPVGYLIDFKPEIMSKIFWDWFRQNKTIQNGLQTISEIIIYAKKLIFTIDESEKFLEDLIKECENNISNELSFNVIESSLLILKWLISGKLYQPFCIQPNYKQSALNGIALDCWAEYAKYGDLTKIPKFIAQEEQVFTKGYLHIISNAISNQNFSFESLKIQHWVYHSCLKEFNYPYELEFKSILSLSLAELDYCVKIAHILPKEFFVHAMRSRSKSSEITSKLIQVISYAPQSVITSNFSDFLDFISFILDYHSLAPQLAKCFRTNIISIRESLHIIINHICTGIDYFKEENLMGRLYLLNSIFVFSPDLMCYIDIFDSIWEALSLIPLSLSLTLVLFDFFNAISRFVDKERQEHLSKIATAVLAAMYQNEIPDCLKDDPIAKKFHTNAQVFYSYISADIIAEPDYTIQKTYVLASPALKILKQTEIPKPVLEYIMMMLPRFLDISPTETTALATELIETAFNDFSNEYKIFCNRLKQRMRYVSSTPVVMIVSYFQHKILEKMPFDFGLNLHSNIIKLPDDENLVRLNIQLNPGIVPMLVTVPSQLFLLLENWAPPTSDVFLNVVSNEASKPLSWQDERYMRSFLRAFGYHQPKSSNITWLTREFLNSDSTSMSQAADSLCQTDNSQCQIDDLHCQYTDEKFEKEKEIGVLEKFAKEYPMPQVNQNQSLALNIAMMYCNSPKCYPFLVEYLTPIATKLVNENPNAFWLLRLLGHLQIRYKFPVESHNKFCQALGVRMRTIPAPLPSNAGDDFLAFETLNAYTNNDTEKRKTLLKRLKSPMLSLRFGWRDGQVTQKILKSILNARTLSQKTYFFYHLASFAEIRSQPEFLVKNENKAIEMILSADMTSPVVFREIFLLIVNLVTQSAHTINSSQICSAFLEALPKSVDDVQLYQSLPILIGIAKLAGTESPGVKSLVESLKSQEFDQIRIQDFQSVRFTILNM